MVGIVNGLASMKFSGSFRIFGVNRKNRINMVTNVINPIGPTYLMSYGVVQVKWDAL